MKMPEAREEEEKSKSLNIELLSHHVLAYLLMPPLLTKLFHKKRAFPPLQVQASYWDRARKTQ